MYCAELPEAIPHLNSADASNSTHQVGNIDLHSQVLIDKLNDRRSLWLRLFNLDRLLSFDAIVDERKDESR